MAAYKNLSDFPEIVAKYLHKGEATHRNAIVRAPCCGFLRSASEIVDVRDVPGTIVKGGGVGPAKDHDWLCSGCRGRMIRDKRNSWTTSKLMEARGAPAQHVVDWRAREDLAEGRRAAFARGEAFKPGEYYEAALERHTKDHQRRAMDEAALLQEK